MTSGCEICATTGQCFSAFHNGPGQFCGSYYDGSVSGNKPCCCPLLAICKISPTQCMCHVANNLQPSSHHSSANYYPSSHQSNTGYYRNFDYHDVLIPLLVIILCVLCCCNRHRERGNDDAGHVPVAVAVPGTYPPPVNPQYHSPKTAYSAQNYGSTMDWPASGGGAGPAIASGLGGLALGTVLGNIIGRSNIQGNNVGYGFGGVGRGGGGGDGGYDIVGDSGDGGCDIAGDS
ncbi:hypothetical protein ACHAW5_011167 [Stephanodiscus triporus]|uniref:Glycine-rich protein n=1 Tax=Stephanodiscus triporus TaxID=2934178 RepID=A0ABD3MRI1_9STRA